MSAVLDAAYNHSLQLADKVYTSALRVFSDSRPKISELFFPKDMAMAELEAIAKHDPPASEQLIDLVAVVQKEQVQQVVSLRLLDEARIAYAKCLVMQSTREISHGG